MCERNQPFILVPLFILINITILTQKIVKYNTVINLYHNFINI
jgi:hypothetical protein